MPERKYLVYLANLDIAVPVFKFAQEDSQTIGQIVVKRSDIPEKLWKGAGLDTEFLRYWFGENAGGNKLIPVQAELSDDKLAGMRVSFEIALNLLKQGKKVTREGWNGKGMWLRVFQGYRDVEFKIVENEGSIGTWVDFIVMKTASRTLVPWIATHTDLLSNDWIEVQENIL